jgi:hypothetical protein
MALANQLNVNVDWIKGRVCHPACNLSGPAGI